MNLRSDWQIFLAGDQRKVGDISHDGDVITLTAGWRVTLVPGIYHEFKPTTSDCIIGEVSTANDDLHDNYFANPDVGRFPELQEDESPIVRLLSDQH